LVYGALSLTVPAGSTYKSESGAGFPGFEALR